MSAVAAPTDVVTRARDILTGRLVPPPLELSPERKAILDRVIREHVEPTPAANRFHSEDWVLGELYGGTVVVYTRTLDGQLAVLGSGEHEFRRLFRELTEEELIGVEFCHPESHEPIQTGLVEFLD